MGKTEEMKKFSPHWNLFPCWLTRTISVSFIILSFIAAFRLTGKLFETSDENKNC